MEEAPLIVAHSHARRAAEETSRARLTVAGSEHESAAEQYARAVEDTSDVEVLRILKLLEDHHSKLAQIVKAKDEFSKKVSATEIKRAEEEAIQDEIASQVPVVTLSGTAQTASPEKLTTTAFLKSRDAPSSLAKDIASRRGIPQSQSRRNPGAASTLSPIQATGRISNPPRSIVTGQHPKPPPNASHTSPSASVESPADEGFSRFYSQLTSGPLSKLSSMLAFPGLPLTEAEDSLSASASPSASTHPTQKEKPSTSARVSTGPDVNALFSRAALKALEEQQRHPGPAFGPGESFYVIPTSGGTASYANILTKTREELRGQGGSKDEDEFVDAREDLDSNPEVDVKSKSKSKHKTSIIPAVNDTDNTLREEELQIENAALKQILDKLSHRLQAFESHAQDASMAMMNQSIVSHHSRSPMGGGGTAGVREEMEERMRAMEAQLEREMKEREKLSMESQKQKLVIAKYRSHWEQLKDSARAREKAKREKGQDVKA
ncbi:hypothetical protein KVT40_002517 [Elsinoe batatas]|uniref:Uncharacterized protein n=1 Tax=Elsinoe batatas TaxID=2601811 RepID=A0A8K0PHL1_9PEZI|nr:hypothetical protein KVT40_002517 [Elsinoe batatas]